MAANLRPLEQAGMERLNNWLPKLSHPVRIGEHDQTAFALGLMLDYARGHWRHEICRPGGIESSAVLFRDKIVRWRMSLPGEDFLSPCLGEADLMRRVLSES